MKIENVSPNFVTRSFLISNMISIIDSTDVNMTRFSERQTDSEKTKGGCILYDRDCICIVFASPEAEQGAKKDGNR